MAKNESRHITLDRFLIQQQHSHPWASGELTQVMVQFGTVAKIISNYMRRIALEGLRGPTGETNVQGEKIKKLDELGNEIFINALEYVDIIGAIVSEEMERPLVVDSHGKKGKYVVLIDPIDGSSNLDVDCMVGSIFSIRNLDGPPETSILTPGTVQVVAGYILYGTSTLLVYSAGDGVHSFVLDEQICEFVLDHRQVRMPDRGKILSANFGNYPQWPQPCRTFVDNFISRDKDRYSLRYSGALVADLHQILHLGGIYLYPEDSTRPEGKLRLLYECAPLAMIAEQAGGAATTGSIRVMEIEPDTTHQRIPFAIGSRYEVEAYEKEYRKAKKT